ncbi:MAG: methionyl-tRNA formyltransferase [Pseudomonadota bacterium]
MRIVFMGTPDFAVPTLEALAGAGHHIVACYSQPPRPAGRRGLELVASPVQQAAERLGIPVFTPKSLKGEAEQTAFAAHTADVAVVVAYGLLLPKTVLEAPKHGCYNGHGSLLPRWRGAAPMQRAIMAGDTETGVQVMKMDVGMDTGPIALTRTTPIDDTTTLKDLHDTLAQLCAEAMVEAMDKLANGDLPLTPQREDGILHAAKIDKAETRIDWTMPAPQLLRHIHGLSPMPGAWCEMVLGGKPVRVKWLRVEVAEGDGPPGTVLDDDLTVACGEGTALRPVELLKAGGKRASRDEFLRGNAIAAGTVLA